jgi:hypothetical protein
MVWWKDVLNFAGTFFSAGLGTVAVQSILPLLRDRWHRKSQANYMAMRLAVTLEAYASGCEEFISNNEDDPEDPPERDDEFNDLKKKLPVLPPFPDDAEGWRAIDAKLANRCLHFLNGINRSQSSLYGFICHPGAVWRDDVRKRIEIHAAELGLQALDLAANVRKKHNVEKTDAMEYCKGYLRNKLTTARTELENRDVISSEKEAREAAVATTAAARNGGNSPVATRPHRLRRPVELALQKVRFRRPAGQKRFSERVAIPARGAPDVAWAPSLQEGAQNAWWGQRKFF